MIVTSTHSILVTSRVNDVPRAGSWAQLARQPCCRTPNAATRAWRAGKATNPVRDGTTRAALCQQARSRINCLWWLTSVHAPG